VQRDSNDEYIRILVDYGLSNAQAKVYFTLVKLGPASLREISQTSKVARSDVYRALIGLQELGLVEKIVAVPTKYNPVHIVDAIAILNQRRKKETVFLTKRSTELIKTLSQPKAENDNKNEGTFVLIRGTEAIERKLHGLLVQAKDSAYVMVPWQRMQQWVTLNFDAVKDALTRNVHIRLITEQPNGPNVSKEYNILRDHPNFDVKHVRAPLIVWLRIYDGNEVVLTMSKKFGSPDSYAVLTISPSVLEMAQSYFNSAWFSAVKLPQQALKDNYQFDCLFANMCNGFSYNKMLFDENGTPIDFVLLDFNSAFEEVTGINRNMLGKNATKALGHLGNSLNEMIALFGKVVSSGKAIRYTHYFPVGQKTFSVLVYTPEEGYFGTFFEDITELQNVQAELQEKQVKYDFLARYAQAGLFEIDCKTFQFTAVNDVLCKSTGYTEAELLSMNPYMLLDDQSKERFQDIIKKSWKSEKIDENVEVGIMTKDGKKRWALLNAKLTFKHSELDCVYVVAKDITEKKELQRAIQKSIDNYRSLFATITEGFAYCRMVYDPAGAPTDFVFLEINSAFEKNSRLSKEAVVGRKVTDVFEGFETLGLLEVFGRVAQTGKTETVEFFFKPLNCWLVVSAYSLENGYFAMIIEEKLTRLSISRWHLQRRLGRS
jgi:PAS domain S-box-containing protein